MSSILAPGTVFAQHAYVVNDLREACRRFALVYGAGPFFLLENLQLEETLYRGQRTPLAISLGFCSLGNLNIEFIQQHSSGPSVYRDVYAPGQEGFHHVAVFCADYHAEKARFIQNGFDAVFELHMSGSDVCYVDTRPALGHMIELYENKPGIRDMFDEFERQTKAWDGREQFIELQL